MPAKLPQHDFNALIHRAGLDLSSAEIDELYGAWENIEPMLDRIRGSGTRPREAEPAMIFRPESTS
jgi:hypothetical protein